MLTSPLRAHSKLGISYKNTRIKVLNVLQKNPKFVTPFRTFYVKFLVAFTSKVFHEYLFLTRNQTPPLHFIKIGVSDTT